MSDLISREALIKELNELRRYVPVPSYKDVFDIIMKAKSIEQTQSVADTLKEAAKICDDYANSNFGSLVDSGQNGAYVCSKAIRALIKRNADYDKQNKVKYEAT